MKRCIRIALVFVFATLLVFCNACNLIKGGAKLDWSSIVEGASATGTATPAEETMLEPSSAGIEEPTVETTSEPPLGEAGVEILGEWDGNTYRNEFLGVIFNQPEGWYHLEKEQILEWSGIVAEQINDAELASKITEGIENGTSIDLMVACSLDGNQNCHLILEILNEISALVITEEKYLEIGEPSLREALVSQRVADLTMDRGTVTMAGKEHPCLHITGIVNGVSFYEIVTVQKQGRYIASYSAAASRSEDLERIIASWSSMEEGTTIAATGSSHEDPTDPTEDSVPETSFVPATEPVGESAAEIPPEEAGIEMLGEWDGNTYRNEFLGVIFTQPESWIHLEQEQILELRGIVTDHITDEEIAAMFAEAGENGTSIILMYTYAGTSTGYPICNLVVEKLNAITSLLVTEEKYIDMTEQALKDFYTSMGAEDLTMERDTIVFAGKEHPCLRVSFPDNGIPFYQTMTVFKKGNYIACSTISSYEPDDIEQVINFWYAIEQEG